MSIEWFFAGILVGIALFWLFQRFGGKKKAADGLPDYSVIEQRLSNIEETMRALLETRRTEDKSEKVDRDLSPAVKPVESPILKPESGSPALSDQPGKKPVTGKTSEKIKEEKTLASTAQIKKPVQEKKEMPAASMVPPRAKGAEERKPSPEKLADPLLRALARDASKSKTVPRTTTPRVSLATETTSLKESKEKVSLQGSSLSGLSEKRSIESQKKAIDPNEVTVKGIFGSSISRKKQEKS